jgi:hypothetical protein
MIEDHRIVIRDAEEIAKRLDQQAVVIIAVERDGTVTIVTYGETKWKCRVIGDWAKGLWKQAISKCPFQTAFGWGNGGKPKKFATADLLMLGSHGAGYVEHNTAKNAEDA